MSMGFVRDLFNSLPLDPPSISIRGHHILARCSLNQLQLQLRHSIDKIAGTRLSIVRATTYPVGVHQTSSHSDHIPVLLIRGLQIPRAVLRVQPLSRSQLCFHHTGPIITLTAFLLHHIHIRIMSGQDRFLQAYRILI